ncbi:hypothetical protein J6590_055658 [Homalodisca vitripennis]|nr:hypothetical protein J6590_055658 [Homalodisca vitripennis]
MSVYHIGVVNECRDICMCVGVNILVECVNHVYCDRISSCAAATPARTNHSLTTIL